MVIVEKITAYEDFLKLEPYWDVLLQKSQNNVVFLTFDFIKTEWEHIGWELQAVKKRHPFVLVAREENELVGLFPFLQEQTTLYGLPVTLLRTLGNIYLDRSDLIVANRHQEIIEKVLHYLTEAELRWDVFFLQNIVEGSPPAVYAATTKLAKWATGIKSGYQSPYVKKVNTWLEYLRSRSKNFHKRIKNKSNSLSKHVGSIVAREYRTPEDLQAALPIVFAIDAKSWKGAEGTALASTEETKQYWQALTSHLSKKDRVRIWILWAGDNAIAFEYHVLYNKTIYSMKWSYDKEYHRYSPGLLLKLKSMESFWREDIAEIDLLGASDDFKEQWTDKKRNHFNLFIFNKTHYSRMVRFVIFTVLQAVSHVKHFYKTISKTASSKVTGIS